MEHFIPVGSCFSTVYCCFTLSVVVKDVLKRLMLPIEDLRAQTYDGAANTMQSPSSTTPIRRRCSHTLLRLVQCLKPVALC